MLHLTSEAGDGGTFPWGSWVHSEVVSVVVLQSGSTKPGTVTITLHKLNFVLKKKKKYKPSSLSPVMDLSILPHLSFKPASQTI